MCLALAWSFGGSKIILLMWLTAYSYVSVFCPNSEAWIKRNYSYDSNISLWSWKLGFQTDLIYSLYISDRCWPHFEHHWGHDKTETICFFQTVLEIHNSPAVTGEWEKFNTINKSKISIDHISRTKILLHHMCLQHNKGQLTVLNVKWTT